MVLYERIVARADVGCQERIVVVTRNPCAPAGSAVSKGYQARTAMMAVVGELHRAYAHECRATMGCRPSPADGL
jgi:hypothetical protein